MSYKKTRITGVFYNSNSKRYMARKTIDGKQHKETFDHEAHARLWRATFDGETSAVKNGTTSTLRAVWKMMQEEKFPTLAESTKEIWLRRYELLVELEEFRMEEISPDEISAWITRQHAYFKSEEYLNSGRGRAKRCNLDNELNLFTTIFNWYKGSKQFKAEAASLTNPVLTEHKKMSFIRPKPIKDKGITLDAALLFFNSLKPLYEDLALFQFFSASRISEAAGLQWPRVDIENRRITIMETCRWDMTSKQFIALNQFPKNREPRCVYMTDEILAIMKRRMAFRIPGNDFVFHAEGKPLNYSTIQLNYREAQRKSGVPYTGTHILRHGMAKLARKVGGGLDAVMAMTGHKDFKLADHYSKLDNEYQKEVSIKIMDHIRGVQEPDVDLANVLSLASFAKAK